MTQPTLLGSIPTACAQEEGNGFRKKSVTQKGTTFESLGGYMVFTWALQGVPYPFVGVDVGTRMVLGRFEKNLGPHDGVRLIGICS